jgi:predicted metal-binding protein
MKIGIIICDRYKSCAGGKCFRSMQERAGAFSIYAEAATLEIAGYTSCGGCPGGNIEYAIDEMLKNGVEAVHLATGFVVGYPPCPYIDQFKKFIEEKYDIPVIIGTHPIPQKYYIMHQKLGTWDDKTWQEFILPTLANESIRRNYD